MSEPTRIQRKRTKGWKLPPNTVCVTRPGKWGNPFTGPDAVDRYREYMCGAQRGLDRWNRDRLREQLHELHGKNLACWCAPDKPCHADVLLKLAKQARGAHE